MSPASPNRGVASGARAAALVTTMAATAVVGGWLGSQLDAQLGSRPFGLILGLVVGFAGGLVPLYRALLDRPPPPDPPALAIEHIEPIADSKADPKADQDPASSDDERQGHLPE